MGEILRDEALLLAEEISNEGIVLLQNDGILPLAEGVALNVFGTHAMNVRFGGGGSGAADQTRAFNLFEGLSQANISYNTELFDFYLENFGMEEGGGIGIIDIMTSMLFGSAPDEPEISYLTEEEVKG